MASFEVVAMALDAPARLEVFVRYYNRMGAERVTLFFDGVPDPAVLALDGVNLEVCDDSFWKNLGLARPAAVEDRQRAVYNHHYSRCISDWLLVVDCDEFVFGNINIGAVLDEVPASAEAVRVGSAEAVFTRADDIGGEFSANHFRLPFGKWSAPAFCRLLYKGDAGVFIRGLLGHSIGKQFVRTGNREILIDIHHISRNGNKIRPCAANGTFRHGRMYLAHFDVVGFSQWCSKWDRRTLDNDVKEMGRKRERQQDEYIHARAKGQSSKESLFRRLYCLDRWQFFLLRVLGKLIAVDLELNRPDRNERTRDDSFATRISGKNMPRDWPQRVGT